MTKLGDWTELLGDDADRIERCARVEVRLAEKSEDGPRRFRMVAYTGVDVSRFWGRMVIDLASIECPEKLPILLEHDDACRVGVADKHEVTDEGLILEGFLLDNEDAQALARDADAGWPFKASVGVRFKTTEEVAEGAELELNGRKFRGPLTVARGARLFETSFIAANPADLATTAEVLNGQETSMDPKLLAELCKANPALAAHLEQLANAGGEARAKALAEAAEILKLFAHRPKFAAKCVRAGMTLLEAKAAWAEKTLAEKPAKKARGAEKQRLSAAEKKTLERLKLKARTSGLGFDGAEREESAAGDTSDEAKLARLKPEERARVEFVEKPALVQCFSGDEKLYAKVLEMSKRFREDGRPLYFDHDTVEAAAAALRKWVDPRMGPVTFEGDRGERFGSWGKTGPDYSRITVKGFQGAFYGAFEEELAGMWTSLISFRAPSDQEIETHKWLGHFPQMREWIGNRQEKAMKIYEMQIRNRLYEATVRFDKNDVRFQKFALLLNRLAQAGAVCAGHWAQLVTELLEDNGLCYDGQNFFDTDHTLGGLSGTMSNDLTSSTYPQLNVGDPQNPTEAEAAAIITHVIPHLFTFKANNGEPLNGGMRRILIEVPVNMVGAFDAALKAQRLSMGQDNPVKLQRLTYEVVPNQRRTSASLAQVHVFRADGIANAPIITQEPSAPEMLVQGPGSAEEFNRHSFVYGIEATRAAGYGAWESALRLTLD